MPMPNRYPYVVDVGLALNPVERLIEQRAVIAMQCHGCRHEAVWRAIDLHRKFPKRLGLKFGDIAPRLRCSRCRSEWLEVVRFHGAQADRYHEWHAR